MFLFLFPFFSSCDHYYPKHIGLILKGINNKFQNCGFSIPSVLLFNLTWGLDVAVRVHVHVDIAAAAAAAAGTIIRQNNGQFPPPSIFCVDLNMFLLLQGEGEGGGAEGVGAGAPQPVRQTQGERGGGTSPGGRPAADP